MKTSLIALIWFFFALHGNAQNDSLRNLDINLENYQYPFPVNFLPLDLQGEKLKMAYMDGQSLCRMDIK